MSLTTVLQDKPILVVDDEPGIRATLSIVLSREGYSVTAVSDVPSAAAALEGAHFAAILTDLRMPGLPGVALVEEVAGRGLQTPVILMSGALESLDEDPRIDLLAGLLAKPICFDTLCSLLQAVTEGQS